MLAREIINVAVGQAGNQVGEAFWKMILAEHGLDDSGHYHGTDSQQLDRIGVYFTEVEARAEDAARYVPRSVQVDLEGGVTSRIRGGPMGGLFKPDTYIAGDVSAGNNWAKGFYTEGAELVDIITETLRKQAEPCDALQGFQIIHSLGGGTGAGLGSLLLSKIREEFPDTMLPTFSILPSPRVSETVVEPYNMMLSVHQLVEHSDMTICLDNEALYGINERLKVASPTFDDLNGIIARVMGGVSTSLRFPGQLNGDLRKLGVNLIPFPRLHFLVPSYAPLHAAKSVAYQSHSVSELTAALFDRKSFLVACDPRQGRYLTAAAIYRGKISSSEVENCIIQLQRANSSFFVNWIPDNVQVALCSVPPVGVRQAATCLSNTTSIKELFTRTYKQFAPMYKRKAFLQWYIGEGMDELEFDEAQSNALDLIAEYQQYEEAEFGNEDGGEYYDEEPSITASMSASVVNGGYSASEAEGSVLEY